LQRCQRRLIFIWRTPQGVIFIAFLLERVDIVKHLVYRLELRPTMLSRVQQR